jgi:UDP-N-acetylglucosamine--N-acetylmuramyl-(pentapeptide) pyrophosphoryl-undecaprenol N-acetylglucosamine transferase
VSTSIVIAGGGTAGHVYPGLALADAITEIRRGARISFVGTRRGIETTAVPKAGYELDLIEVTPYARTLGAKRFTAPASLATATRAAARLLRRRDATVVVSMGGYASLPVSLAAKMLRLPLVIHEQNAIPGIANVIAARVTRLIAVAFPAAAWHFPHPKLVRVLGNPIRHQIATLDREARRNEAIAAFGLDAGRATVLVAGGSLGAARLNEAAVACARRWAGRTGVQILLATGREHASAVRDAARDLEALHVVDFIERMELAYAAADVAVCRAGAASVMELACVGLPGVLVPYPFARRNHQAANALALERAGGAVIVRDAEATGDRLADAIEPLLEDSGRRAAMAKGAREFAKPRAAQDLAQWVLEVARR